MRWLVSIVVGLCLVGAGSNRARAEHHDPHAHSELADASHLTAKLLPRRISSVAPEQRLAAFVVPLADLGGVPSRQATWIVDASVEPPTTSAWLPGWRCRGPPG